MDETTPIKSPTIVIVDGWPIVRAGLSSILAEWWPNPIIELDNLKDLPALRGEQVVSLIVSADSVSVRIDHMVRHLRQSFPQVSLVLRWGEAADMHVSMARKLGVNGCVFADSDKATIYNVLGCAVAGEYCYPWRCEENTDDLPAFAKKACDFSVLSRRELTVLHWLMKGLNNTQVAEQLYLSPKTVSAHKRNALKKLRVKSIVELRVQDIVEIAHPRHQRCSKNASPDSLA